MARICIFGLPPHNPKPTTARGKRRKHKLTQDQLNKVYATDRSSNKSRYQRKLEENR